METKVDKSTSNQTQPVPNDDRNFSPEPDRTRGTGLKLKEDRFTLDIRKNIYIFFLILKVVRH